MTDVTFDTSLWIVTDMKITLKNCDMSNLSILVQKESSNSDVHLNVTNTQIGSPIMVKEAAAILENCGSMPKTQALIMADNSKVTVESSYFAHFHGAFMMNATVGHFRNVKFMNCDSTAPLITGTNQSLISIENCTFLSNMAPLVSIQHISVGNITHSTIINNTFRYTLLHPAPCLIAGIGDVLLLQELHLFQNTVENGSAVGVWNTSTGIILSSEFSNNSMRDHVIVHLAPFSTIIIYASKFLNNEGCAVRAINHSVVVIRHSSFLDNLANHGAAISLESEHNFLINGSSSFYQKMMLVPQNKILTDFFKNLLDFHFMSLPTTQENLIYNCTFANNSALLGGAIFAAHVSLILVKNSFTNNSAAMQRVHGHPAGGAICLSYCHAMIANSTFEGNKAFVGGAISADVTTLSIQSSNFSKNYAAKTSLASGGAIFAVSQISRNVTSVISECSFRDNQASGFGGAIAASDPHVLIQIGKSIFKTNRAIDGGAIFCQSSDIESCQFDSNAADYGGALHFFKQNIISHTNFSSNSAFHSGGAILGEKLSSLSCKFCSFDSNSAGFRYVFTLRVRKHSKFLLSFFSFLNWYVYSCKLHQVPIATCLFSRKTTNVGKGGALALMVAETLTLIHSCFTNNSAGDQGGAVWSMTEADVLISSCLFQNNTSTQGGAVYFGKSNLEIFMKNCTFRSNAAMMQAGALHANSTALAISNSEFSENEAPVAGAIYFSGEQMMYITQCNIFRTNCQNKFMYPLSAIVTSATIILSNSTLFENENGGLTLLQGKAKIVNSVFCNNSGKGAIRAAAQVSLLKISNTSFVVNRGLTGSALSLGNPLTLIENSRFVGIASWTGKLINVQPENSTEVRIFSTFFTMPKERFYGDEIKQVQTVLNVTTLQEQNIPMTLYVWKTMYKRMTRTAIQIDKTFINSLSSPFVFVGPNINFTSEVSLFASGK